MATKRVFAAHGGKLRITSADQFAIKHEDRELRVVVVGSREQEQVQYVESSAVISKLISSSPAHAGLQPWHSFLRARGHVRPATHSTVFG